MKLIMVSSACAWLLLAAAGCDRGSAAVAAHPRIAMIVAPVDFDDQEYSVTGGVLERAGARVMVAGTTGGQAINRGGTVVRPDRAVRELAADRLDAGRRKKVVAAICLAPGALARAGVLAGRKATCYPDPVVVAELEGGGADYVEAAVVAAENIVTGSGPQSASELGARILEALGRSAAGPAAGPAQAPRLDGPGGEGR